MLPWSISWCQPALPGRSTRHCPLPPSPSGASATHDRELPALGLTLSLQNSEHGEDFMAINL